MNNRQKRLKPRRIKAASDYVPLKHQEEFHKCHAKYRAIVSGVGGGKTTMGVREVLKWTQLYPGGLFIIGRLTQKALENTTQRRFFEICPPELVEHWQSNKGHLWLKTPAVDDEGDPVFTEILFMHLDDPGPLGSLDISGFWIDEAHEPDGGAVPESTFQLLQARLRNEIGPHRGFVTSNSGGKDWVWRWFFDPSRPKHMIEEFWGITVSSRDNPHLPPGYVEGLVKNNPKHWVERFIDASFDAFEGQIFIEFNEADHVISHEVDLGPDWEPLSGFDFGVTAPTAFLAGAYNQTEDILYISDEIYEYDAKPEEIAEEMKKLGFDWSWADPSVTYKGVSKVTPQEIYEAFGISLIASDNNEDTFFTMLKWRMRHNKIIIHERCENLINELKGAEWDSGYYKGRTAKPRPKKDKDHPDHARDALKYMMLRIGVACPLDSAVDPRDVYEEFEELNKLHPSVIEDLQEDGYLFDEIVDMVRKGKVPL